MLAVTHSFDFFNVIKGGVVDGNLPCSSWNRLYKRRRYTERHLNNDGVNQCHLTGRALNKLDITFDLIVSNPKVRARQTADIIAIAQA